MEMSDGGEYKKGLGVLINNLEGSDLDFRPLSYKFTMKLARFARLIHGGMTCEEAEKEMANTGEGE